MPGRMLATFFALIASVWQIAAAADPPLERTSSQFLPADTFVYARITSIESLRQGFADSTTGRMLADPQVAPLVESFTTQLLDRSTEVEKRLGMPLDAVLQLFQGEVAFGVVPVTPTDLRPFFVIELQGQSTQFRDLVETLAERVDASEIPGSGVELLDCQIEVGGDRFVIAETDDRWIITAEEDHLEALIKDVFEQEDAPPRLSDNAKFREVMSRCAGTEEARPVATLFVDPIAIAKFGMTQSVSGALAYSLLPALGIDGVQAVGGSVIYNMDEFESVMHFHVALESPRRGVLEVIRPLSGKIEPEMWVGEDCVTYATFNWDISSTFQGVEQIVDTFQQPGAFAERMADLGKRMKVDVEQELIDQFDDRISVVQISLQPATLDSEVNFVAVHLKDPEHFAAETLPGILRAVAKRGTSEDYAGVRIHHESQKRKWMPTGREHQWTLAVIGRQLVFCDSLLAMQQIIDRYNSGDGLLSDSLEYKLMRQRIDPQLGDRTIYGQIYSRPDEALRRMYDLAMDPNNREKLAEAAEQNPAAAFLSQLLEENDLPPFQVLQKYFNPAGGFFAHDETGLHLTMFSLKR